jgi:hypothetical protein
MAYAPGVVSTAPNYNTLGRVQTGFQGLGAIREAAPDALATSIDQIFGNKANIHATSVVNDLDALHSAPHGTTGIPYAISGTATVVQLAVAQRLADYVDPIKALLGVGVHREQKIIIKRQYVAGGGAGIVPERAPARTVALMEDVREVVLTRYGGDIEFNMNLLLRPEDARREMSLKVAAQEKALEEALTNIGYDMLLSEGTNLVSALIRSNHLLHSDGAAARQSGNTSKYMINHAERIYMTSVFGAMNKFPYPVHNLLAAAKKASAYDVSRATKTVMILPHGLPELLKYTRPETMVYNVSGTGPEPLQMELDGGHLDPSTGCTIFTHIPPSSNIHGSANPVAERSALSGNVTIAIVSPGADAAENAMIFDWKTLSKRKRSDFVSGLSEEAKTVDTSGDGVPSADASVDAVKPAAEGKDFVQILTFSMSSAILGVPGGGCGELLIGYPSTALSTNASTESGRMQLRCYLGSVLYRPEDVLIMPDVSFDGLVDVQQFTGTADKTNYYNIPEGKEDEMSLSSINPSIKESKYGGSFKIMAHKCSLWKGDKLVRTNEGHLGPLDSPEQHIKVFGTQVYDAGPPLQASRNTML